MIEGVSVWFCVDMFLLVCVVPVFVCVFCV